MAYPTEEEIKEPGTSSDCKPALSVTICYCSQDGVSVCEVSLPLLVNIPAQFKKKKTFKTNSEYTHYDSVLDSENSKFTVKLPNIKFSAHENIRESVKLQL